jgi:hypothetical protein
MLEFLFDLPLLITGPAIIGSLWLFAVAGLVVVRRQVLPRLRIQVADSEFAGAMLQSVMVFYGLAVALIAVSVWQTYSDVSKIVSGEASSLNALYRDVSSYPESTRLDLQKELRVYTDQVIHQAWPLQRRGQIPTAGVEHMSRFQAVLDEFEPATEGQKLLHGENPPRLQPDDPGSPFAAGCGGHWSAGGDVGRGRRGCLHRLERLLFFQSGGRSTARHPGAPPGDIHRAGHFHDFRAGPSLPGRPGTAA